ncbi:MAG: DUF1801 domain-containing protein [Flavobacteriales bacterium]|nr:DUF1801 domain-containing protein [Flavobacteriales bacterium]
MPTRPAKSSKLVVKKSTNSKPAPKTDLNDWRDATLSRMRTLILEADPAITEEQKWKKPSNPAGVPVWSHSGIICTGETYKDKVKLTFMHGAALPDPAGLFNAPGTGGTRRAIDIREGEKVDATKFKALVKSAVALNSGSAKKKTQARPSKAGSVKLLSGGNPQIAKGDGDAPVQGYIAAAPGWTREACRRIDALIVRAVPKVKKAVKWNSPFYGIEGQGWFVSYHIFTKYVKINFFFGRKLKPMPPVGSKDPNARYVHLHEDGVFDEAQFMDWVKQAAKLPGWSGH